MKQYNNKTRKQKFDLVNKFTSGSVNQESRKIRQRLASAGQASIVFLIISAIALTLGLVSTRNVTVDTKIDTNIIEKNEATNVAESAIESYLGQKERGSSYVYLGSGGAASGVGATVTSSSLVATENGGYYTLKFDKLLGSGDFETYWMVGHQDDGTIVFSNNRYLGGIVTICVNGAYSGSLGLENYYLNNEVPGKFKVSRTGWDININTQTPVFKTGNMILTEDCPGNIDLKKVADFDTDNGNIQNVSHLLVIRSINNSTRAQVAVVGSSSFPAQGFSLTSQGVAGQSRSTIRTQLRWGIPVDEFMLFGVSGANIK